VRNRCAQAWYLLTLVAAVCCSFEPCVTRQLDRARRHCKCVKHRNAELLVDGVWQMLGRLMNESHASCSQDYECSCDELDSLTSICRYVYCASVPLVLTMYVCVCV
jgi:hypothetical protein